MLPLQLRQGFVPVLPGVMVDVHIQHRQPAAGGNTHVIELGATPPCLDLAGVAGGVLAAVRSGRSFSPGSEGKHAQAHFAIVKRALQQSFTGQ